MKVSKGKWTLRVNTASSYGIRFWGLMMKTQWPRSYDALWFPQCASVHSFFTFLKPDLIFLDKDYRVLAIHSQVPAWRFWFGPPGTFGCLEAPAGEAEKRGWKKRTLLEKYFVS